MGRSTEEFVKYPRTPHIFCEYSKMSYDDKGLTLEESKALLQKKQIILEEKLDGTNVGISGTYRSHQLELFLQCRGHEITAGMHPQFDLFKSWAQARKTDLLDILGDRYVLYGEWVYAVHTKRYNALPHYFHEFDIWDRHQQLFIDTPSRHEITQLLGLISVPVLYAGKVDGVELLQSFIGKKSLYGDEPIEGLYGKIEEGGVTLGRFKFIDPQFTQTILDSEEKHWLHRKMEIHGLKPGTDIYAS
ncbi:MAG: RNA ligase family protein [Planctomycetota bacterium]